MDRSFLVVLDREERIESLSSGFGRFLGYEPRSLVQRPFYSLAPCLIGLQEMSLLKQLRLRRDVGPLRFILTDNHNNQHITMITGAFDEISLRFYLMINFVVIAKESTWSRHMSHAVNTAYGCMSLDSKGVITYCNEIMADYLGIGPGQLLGKNLLTYEQGLQSDRFWQNVAENLEKKPVWVGPLKFRHQSGSFVYLRALITKVHGTINGSSPLGEDPFTLEILVFDQTTIESEIERFAWSQSIAKIGHWVYDKISNRLKASGQMSAIFQDHFDPKSGLSMLSHLLHPDDLEIWNALISRCLEHGESFSQQVRSYRGQDVCWIECFVRPLFNGQGAVIGLEGTCQDKTLQVVAENQNHFEKSLAIHRAKLASLGEISAGISHEINNPLTIIRGAAAVIAKNLGEPEKLLHKVATIDHAVERISGVIKGLNRFSRDGDKIEVARHKIGKLVRDAIFFIEVKAKALDIKLSVNGPESCEVSCDGIQVEQAIVDLLQHSIESAVLSQEKWIDMSWHEDFDSLVLNIEDSGLKKRSRGYSKFDQQFLDINATTKQASINLAATLDILENNQAQYECIQDGRTTLVRIKFSSREGFSIVA